MFNLFKKKEKPALQSAQRTPRDLLLGDLTVNEWLGNGSAEIPWSLFNEARNQFMVKSDLKSAVKTYQKILGTPGLESRHYLQAWHFLRKLGTNPSPDIANQVYGMVVDVVIETGVETVAGYADHHARYFHSSGGATIWEAPNDSLNNVIDALLKTGEAPAKSLKPLDKHPLAPGNLNQVQICVLTPAGIRHGVGTFEGWSKDPMGGPILMTATNLMKALVDLNRSK